MKWTIDRFVLELHDERAYTFGSVDNPRSYGREYLFGDRLLQSSAHGLLCHDSTSLVASALLGAVGGGSGVHEHSLATLGDKCFVAVGPFVACVRIPSLDLEWHAEVDPATCFGIHLTLDHTALVSHGELEIAKLTVDGQVLWSTGGADVFSEPIEILSEAVIATDFYGRRYRFDLATGASSEPPGA